MREVRALFVSWVLAESIHALERHCEKRVYRKPHRGAQEGVPSPGCQWWCCEALQRGVGAGVRGSRDYRGRRENCQGRGPKNPPINGYLV